MPPAAPAVTDFDIEQDRCWRAYSGPLIPTEARISTVVGGGR